MVDVCYYNLLPWPWCIKRADTSYMLIMSYTTHFILSKDVYIQGIVTALLRKASICFLFLPIFILYQIPHSSLQKDSFIINPVK